MRELIAGKPGGPNTGDFAPQLPNVDSPLGNMTYLANSLQYSTMPGAEVRGPVSFGRDKPQW